MKNILIIAMLSFFVVSTVGLLVFYNKKLDSKDKDLDEIKTQVESLKEDISKDETAKPTINSENINAIIDETLNIKPSIVTQNTDTQVYIKSLGTTKTCKTSTVSAIQNADDYYTDQKNKYDTCIAGLKNKMDEEAKKSEQCTYSCGSECIKNSTGDPTNCFDACSKGCLEVLESSLAILENNCEYITYDQDQVTRLVLENCE